MSRIDDPATADDDLARWATWQEIHTQPDAWLDWIANFDASGLHQWINQLDVDQVWFCGAGSSAYIGDILAHGLTQSGRFKSVASTDLVASPQHYLNGCNPLVVNFGRSGNSAESIGTLDALDALAPNAPRLNITCNPSSVLATRAGSGQQRVILMPETAVDTGFAMTCSFSTMLLSAVAVFDEPDDLDSRVQAMSKQLRELLPVFSAAFTKDMTPMPERVVFLGAGALTSMAREAALKVLELTAGQIPAIWDSTLGFRHGPKSFINDETVVKVFLSPDTPARLYDDDLVAELRLQFPAARVQTIGPGGDIDVPMPYGSLWSVPVCAAAAQVAGVIWANNLGFNVDDPFAGRGTLTRVVANVPLYSVAPA